MTKQEVFAKHFDFVAVVGLTGDSLTVSTHFKGVDRPNTGPNYGLRLSDRKLAERLARALSDVRCYDTVEIKTDVNGRTYVNAFIPVLGRKMNADLKRLGY